MNFFRYKPVSEELGTIELENLFIMQYMPGAPGDYVKVYILGLKASLSPSSNMLSNQIMAKTLNLSEKAVKDAWNYWEQQGIIKIYALDYGNEDDISVEFLSIREINKTMDKSEKVTDKYSNDRIIHAMEKPKVSEMFEYIKRMTGRLLSPTDMFIFLDWLDDYNFSPELVLLLIEECYSKDKKNFNYISKVAKTWYNNGINTLDKAKNYLEKQDYVIMFDKISKLYGSEISEEMMSSLLDWINDFKFAPDLAMLVVEDCYSRGKKDLRYLNSVASKWYSENINSVDSAKEYMKKHKEKWQKYGVVLNFIKMGRPTTIEEEMLYKWFYTYNFTEDIVLKACAETIATTKPLISNIDKHLNKWYESGLRTLPDVESFIASGKTQNTNKPANTNAPKKNSFNNFTGRTYDAKKLEDMLLNKSRGELSE